MCVCDIRGSLLEFLTEERLVWCKIFSIHLVIRRFKPDKKNSTIFIFISGSKCGGEWKNMKMSYSIIDNSAILEVRGVGFSWLDRACIAAHWANVGFSISGYSPVLHQQKSPAQGFYKINYGCKIT
jgi:hypothetical protein